MMSDREEVMGAVARGWCHAGTSHLTMDEVLAMAIVDEVMLLSTQEPTQRCPSILAGHICPDDICRNASERTLCGAWVEDMDDTRAWDLGDDDDVSSDIWCDQKMPGEDAHCNLLRDHTGWHRDLDSVGALRARWPNESSSTLEEEQCGRNVCGQPCGQVAIDTLTARISSLEAERDRAWRAWKDLGAIAQKRAENETALMDDVGDHVRVVATLTEERDEAMDECTGWHRRYTVQSGKRQAAEILNRKLTADLDTAEAALTESQQTVERYEKIQDETWCAGWDSCVPLDHGASYDTALVCQSLHFPIYVDYHDQVPEAVATQETTP